MKNSKINKDRPKPSSKEIKETKDFDFILKNQPKNNNRILKIIGLIGIAIIGVIASKKHLNKPTIETKPISEVSKQNIELKIKSDNSETLTISPIKRQSITLKDNSIIHIPSNAFINSKNELEDDSVTLTYNYFKSVPEIFMSDIPMTYDSAKTQYHFESAGMFELRAFDRNGNTLKTNPNALIQLEMSSYNDDNKFNSYYLEGDSTWKYLNSKKPFRKKYNKTSLDSLHQTNLKKIKEYKERIEKVIRKNLPKIPNIANKDRYAVNLKFDTIKFPELAPFKNILFEVLPNNPEFNLEEVKANWTELELDKKKGRCILTLFKKGIKKSIIVQPVMPKESERINQAIFTKLYEKSKLKNTQLYQKEQTILDSLKEINKKITDSISFVNQRAINNAYESSEEVKNQNLVYRTFTIENFGIFNSDCPTNLPSGVTIDNPIFVNKKDTLKFHKMFIAEYGSNTIYTLYVNSFTSSISYNPTKPAVIWGVTNKNKLAVFNFKDYNQKLKSSKILMNLNDLSSATNLDSIRNALQWQ